LCENATEPACRLRASALMPGPVAAATSWTTAELRNLGSFLQARLGSIAHAFTTLETQGNGRVTLEVFAAALLRMGYTEDADELFHALDTQGIGMLHRATFLQAFPSVGPDAGDLGSRERSRERSRNDPSSSPWANFRHALEALDREQPQIQPQAGHLLGSRQPLDSESSQQNSPPQSCAGASPTSVASDVSERLDRIEAQLAAESRLRQDAEQRIAKQVGEALSARMSEATTSVRMPSSSDRDSTSRSRSTNSRTVEVEVGELRDRVEMMKSLLERRLDSLDSLVAKTSTDLRSRVEALQQQKLTVEECVDRCVHRSLEACRSSLERGQANVLTMAKQAVAYATEASRACAGLDARMRDTGDEPLCSLRQVDLLLRDRIARLQAEWEEVFEDERAHRREQAWALSRALSAELLAAVSGRSPQETARSGAAEEVSAILSEAASLEGTAEEEARSLRRLGEAFEKIRRSQPEIASTSEGPPERQNSEPALPVCSSTSRDAATEGTPSSAGTPSPVSNARRRITSPVKKAPSASPARSPAKSPSSSTRQTAPSPARAWAAATAAATAVGAAAPPAAPIAAVVSVAPVASTAGVRSSRQRCATPTSSGSPSAKGTPKAAPTRSVSVRAPVPMRGSRSGLPRAEV